jgi:Putative adhesin
MKSKKIHIATLRLAILAALTLGGPMLVNAAEPAAPQNLTITTEGSDDKALEQLWRVAGDAMIEVTNIRGSVTVSAGDASRVKLGGSLGSGSKLVVSGDEHHLTLEVESRDDLHGWFGKNGPGSDSNLVLNVPHGTSLKVDVVSADVKVAGIDGKSLSVSSVSGDAMIGGNASQVDVESVSGGVKFDTASTDANGRMHLQTVSGDVVAKGGAGRVKLETVSGEVTLRTNEVQEIEAGTVSGTIEIHATPAKHGRLHLDTMSGSVRVYLPASVSARIDAETFSGSLHSDFGKVEKPEFGPGSSLSTRTGEGDAQINAQAFSGDVEIRKQQ